MYAHPQTANRCPPVWPRRMPAAAEAYHFPLVEWVDVFVGRRVAAVFGSQLNEKGPWRRILQQLVRPIVHGQVRDATLIVRLPLHG